MKADFLCIGSPKCGTTWLHELLDEHPDVFLPSEIKEIHFFDRYYDRGVDWYDNLFSNGLPDQRKGEVTPHYLYMEDCTRLFNYNPAFKLIVLYRDPVERCISHYKYRIRLDNYNGSFSQFLEDYPNAQEWSCYGGHLSKYLRVFPKDQVLLVPFEKAVKNIPEFKESLSTFLQLDSSKFPFSAGSKKVNADMEPRYPRLYRLSVRISRIMVDLKLYKFRNVVKTVLVKALKTKSMNTRVGELEISENDRKQLEEYFKNDQELLTQLQLVRF